MSQQGRPATSGSGGQPRPRCGNATASSPQQQQQQQQARTTTPTNSRTILDELLALGQLGELSSSAQLDTCRRRQRSPSEQPPNVTIIDYRDVAAPWHAPKEIVTPFDEFQNQWRSMAAAAGAATSATTTADGGGGGGGDSTTSSSATLALPPSAPVGAPGLAILDIRRTKTNRRKRRARSRDYENLGPPLYAGAESSGSEDEEEPGDDGCDQQEEVRQNRTAGQQQQQQQQPTTTTSQQQARQQAAGQQRQQSGETLSSFESDYDLLLYLGETETEDLVETERSLDYLDQTWRQSICGGASLAPTLDESLSDVLHQHQSHNHQQQQPYHDDFDQLWRPASGNGHALNRRGQQQQQVRARVTSNQNNLSPNQSVAAHSSASLPRQSDLNPSRAGQQHQATTLLQPAAAASGSRAHTLKPRATQLEHEQLTLVVGQPQQVAGNTSGASGLGSKFVSLFGGERAKQPAVDPAAATRELDELLARGHAGQPQTMGPPKPKRQRPYAPHDFEAELPPPPPPGGADELDRLLAEMSQSLDLDSLARYDPHRGTSRPTQVGHQQPQASRSMNQTTAPSSKPNTMTTQNTWSQAPTQRSTASNQRTTPHAIRTPYENQDREQQTTTTTTASSESILNDYDGASRMLEQMISDQLAEAAALSPRPTSHTTGGRRQPVAPNAARSTKSKSSSSTRSSDQENATEPTTTATSGANTKRKVSSTCSSSVATQDSVIARQDEREQDEPKYSNQSALWRHKQAVARSAGGEPPTHQSESNLLAGGRAAGGGGGGQKKSADPRLRNLKHSPNYSRSLDVEMAPEVRSPPSTGGARVSPPIENNQQQKILTVRQESPSLRSSSRRSSTTTTTTTNDDQAENKAPPKPPAPDYCDFRTPPTTLEATTTHLRSSPPSGNQVIQVEAAEMSTSTTTSESEQEDSARGRGNGGASRHKKMISRMRRRTLTSMRQIRDKFGQFAGGTNSPDKDRDRVVVPKEPEPPKRSSSIASSSRDGRGGSRGGGGVPEPEVGVSPQNAHHNDETAAVSPRQSRQRERKGAPPNNPENEEEQAEPAEGKKSFGRQWRERLSRSKSRFTQFIRGDSSQRKRAQSTPDERRAATAAAQEPVSFLLPQPSDIARNERNTQESSLERHLKASLVNDVTAPVRPVVSPTSPAQRKVSTSSNRSLSSDLSGLETTATTKAGGRRFERPARRTSRSSGKRKSGASGELVDQPTGGEQMEENSHKPPARKRPASLISLKRFSESIGKMAATTSPPEGSAEELESLESAALRAKRKRAGKRQRNRSSGARLMDGSSSPSSPTNQLVSPKRATTDDYFGLVAPLRTPGDELAHPVTPVSSVHQRVEMGPKVRPASVLLENGENSNGRFAFRRNRKLPDRSQSLKSQPGDAATATRRAQGTRSVAGSHHDDNEPATSGSGENANVATHQKAVSFHNLATPTTPNNQRRQLSPVAPNTFRPASAASQVFATPPTQTLTASTLEITDVRYADSPITPVQPISGAHLRMDSPPPTVGPGDTTSLRTSARSPMRERGATLLGDIKSKYNELFSKSKTTAARSKSTDQPAGLPLQPPPHRPPRRRNRKSANDDSAAAELPRRSKSLAAPPREAQPPDDGEAESSHFIELAPASPPLSLGPLSVTPSESPQPEGATLTTTRRPAKRLASFASQLRNSAVDFFNAAGPNSAQRKPPTASPQPPALGAATAPTTASTVNERPKHFATRNLDEPMLQRDLAQWRPIIPSTRGGASNATGVKRSASFKLAKDANANAPSGAQEGAKPDYKKGHTLASGQLRLAREHKSLDDSDSTWDSESGSENVEIVQGAQDREPTRVVHDNDDESPSSRQRRRREAASEQQAQVCAASEAQSAKGGRGGGIVGEGTSAVHHASVAPTSGKLPAATILLEKSASIGSEQQAGTLGVDEQHEREKNHALKTSSGSSLKNDQNNNIHQSKQIDKTKALETQAQSLATAAAAANQSDELSLARVGLNKLTDCSEPQRQQPAQRPQSTQRPSVTNEGQPLVVCSNHCPLPRRPSDNSTEAAAAAAAGQAPNVQLFKFKDILPSPGQILEETRWRERRDQQQQVAAGASNTVAAAERKQRPKPVARANRAEQEPTADDDDETGNRLSIYENVNLGEQINDKQTDDRLLTHELIEEARQEKEARDQETKILNNNNNSKQNQDLKANAMTQDDIRENLTTRLPPRPAAIGATSRGQKPAPPPRPQQPRPPPPRDESDWSVEEPDERLIERMSAKAKEQVVAEQRQEAAAELAKSSQSPPPPPPGMAREPPKRKLISMTSIIQEPEDELMNQATVKVVAPPAPGSGEQVVDLSWPRAGAESQGKFPRADDPRRDSVLFERCNDSDDSDSSLAAPAQSGRKRLLDKLRGQSGSTVTPANEPAKRPPNLPRATGGGGDSLVKRLARNFDQTVQDQPASLGPLARRSPALNSAAASSRSPQQPQQQPVTGTRRPLPGRLSLELDEPKSDSTWYDAKSAELLDEAEVAELLREFESDGLPPGGGGGGQQSQSTDQFVSVANDSTLSHDDDDDERGRRDEPRRAGGDPTGGGGGGGDSDDPTLNDDQTLDDDEDEAGPLVDEEAPPTEESESVYASLATEPTHNSRSAAGPRTTLAPGGDQQSAPSTSKGKDRGELAMAAGSRENSPARRALHAVAVAESPANSAPASAALPNESACNLIADGVAATTAACPATTTACDERVACTAMQLQRQQRGESITPTGADKVNDNVAPCCSPSSSSSLSPSLSALREVAANKNNINKCSRLAQAQHPQLPHDPEPSRPDSVDATGSSLRAGGHDHDHDDKDQTDDIDHEQRQRQQQFKQSLNNIISQKQQQRQTRTLDSDQSGTTTITTSGGEQQMRVAPVDPSETHKDPPGVLLQQQEEEEDESSRKTTGGKKAAQQQQQQLQKSNKCCKKASSLAKEISKCYKALIGASDLAVKGKQQVLQTEQRLQEIPEHATREQPPVESAPAEQVVSARDSVQSQATLSLRVHSDNDDDDDDDGEEEEEEDFQLNTKNLVQAAKKCSQLYEELERLLQIRAAKQRKKSSEVNADEEEEDDVDEESLLADLISEQSSLRGDDVISLSSSSLSSESLPELRQRKNLQKLYNIVNEICTSEEKFVATLKLLNEDFRRHILDGRWATGAGATPSDLAHLHAHAHAYKVNLQQAPFDCIGLVLKHLPQLQALNESLLEELKRAREQWPSTQKISHVLVKIGPFLKHYSSYIRDFEQIQAQFQENLKKSSHFRLAIQTFEASPATSLRLNAGKLSVQHHLLKPIQRIPQYRLLLQQYLHHLKPDDADYEDTVEALEVVSRVAEHANQSLSEGANFAKLLALQAKIVGKQRDIIQPGRLFIKEGELLKVCRKQIQPCWFVLLNDSLLYLKQIQSSDILYLKYELPLDDCQVDLASASERTCPLASSTTAAPPPPPVSVAEQVETATTGEERDRQFNVCTTVRSMTLIARSRAERDEWLGAMRAAIGDQVAKRQSFKSASSKSRLLVANAGQDDQDQTTALRLDQMEREQQQREQDANEALNELVGRKAPIWTPDSRVTRCESCTSNFSALFRRHHCRACGRVVCSACSSNRAPLIYLKCRAARVCDHCFESLRANMHLYYLPSCPIDERELKRLDEHFKTLLKAQFTRERPAHHKQHKHKKPHSLTQPPLNNISPAPTPDAAGTQVTVTTQSGADNTQLQ